MIKRFAVVAVWALSGMLAACGQSDDDDAVSTQPAASAASAPATPAPASQGVAPGNDSSQS